jgi:predicted methyltransferase
MRLAYQALLTAREHPAEDSVTLRCLLRDGALDVRSHQRYRRPMPVRRWPTRLVVVALLSALAAPAGAGPHDATAHHPFDDVEHWASVFDDPGRDAWQHPDEIVRALALRPGAWVADLGAGTGYFSRRLSRAVGSDGVVFAVDTEPNLVAHLRTRAEREETPNVIPVLASPSNPRLPPASFDVVLIVDTYHHIDDRIAYFTRLRRVLRRGARVAVVDWHKRPLPVGPEMEHKLDRTVVVDEMRQSGFRLVAEPKTLPYQYLLIFTGP